MLRWNATEDASWALVQELPLWDKVTAGMMLVMGVAMAVPSLVTGKLTWAADYERIAAHAGTAVHRNR